MVVLQRAWGGSKLDKYSVWRGWDLGINILVIKKRSPFSRRPFVLGIKFLIG
jgi:hypothetical protein